MERRKQNINLTGPVVLIGIGIILLLNNLGYLNWSFWDILQLWPVLLVAAGLELLIGQHSLIGSFVSALIVLLLMVGGVWLVGSGAVTPSGGDTLALAYPSDDTATLKATLAPNITDLTVGDLRDSANLVEGNVIAPNRVRITEDFSGGTHARLTVTAEGRSWFTNPGNNGSWDVAFDPGVELDLDVDIGIGDMEIDLQDLTIDDASVDFGIAQLELRLPEASDDANIHIDGGIGTVTIAVPANVGLRLRSDAGLVTRDLPSGYTQSGNTFTSPNYEGADYQVTVTLGLGIGTYTVTHP